MKSLLQLSAIIALTFAGNTGYAQKLHSNSVKLMSAGFHISGRQTISFLSAQLGAAYERRIFKNFFAGISLHRWEHNVPEPFNAANMLTGLMQRNRYKMIDVSILYKHQFSNSNHVVAVGIGPSYCWGTNHHHNNKSYYPKMDVFNVKTYAVSYYGIVPQISYDYNFLCNRLNAGVDLRARYYTGRAPGQYDYGVHVGVNF